MKRFVQKIARISVDARGKSRRWGRGIVGTAHNLLRSAARGPAVLGILMY